MTAIVSSQQSSVLGGAPAVWLVPTVPQVPPKISPRGAAVFIQKGFQEDYREAFHFETSGFARLVQLAATPPHAHFHRAGGWWDILSDASFFFCAGYAVHPPGPPPMRAIAEVQPDSSAPFTFTLFNPALGTAPPSQRPPITGAFATLHENPVAPFSFVRDRAIVVIAPTTLVPSISTNAFGLQLPADTAPFSFTRTVLPLTLLVLPSGTSVMPQQTYDPRDLAGAFNFAWPGLAQLTTTPIVVQLTLQQAIFNVVNAGLEPFVVYAPSNTVLPDIVLAQSPPSGTSLPVNSVVTITASSGPASPQYGQVTVPSLIGLFAKDADQLIFKAGLSLGPYLWMSSTTTGGIVLNQSPAAGTLAAIGSIVTLTLSQGPQYPSYSTTTTTSVP